MFLQDAKFLPWDYLDLSLNLKIYILGSSNHHKMAKLYIKIETEDLLEGDKDLYTSQGFEYQENRLTKIVELSNKEYKLWQNPSLLDRISGRVKQMSSEAYHFEMSVKGDSYNADFSQVFYDVEGNKPIVDSLEKQYLRHTIQKQFKLQGPLDEKIIDRCVTHAQLR